MIKIPTLYSCRCEAARSFRYCDGLSQHTAYCMKFWVCTHGRMHLRVHLTSVGYIYIYIYAYVYIVSVYIYIFSFLESFMGRSTSIYIYA